MQYKILRSKLGFNNRWLAKALDCEEWRVSEWAQGRSDLTVNASLFLQEMQSKFETSTTRTIDSIVNLCFRHEEFPMSISLVLFDSELEFSEFRPDLTSLPLSSYVKILKIVRLELSHFNINTTVHYMKSTWYYMWLGNRKNTELNQITWATMNRKYLKLANHIS